MTKNNIMSCFVKLVFTVTKLSLTLGFKSWPAMLGAINIVVNVDNNYEHFPLPMASSRPHLHITLHHCRDE